MSSGRIPSPLGRRMWTGRNISGRPYRRSWGDRWQGHRGRRCLWRVSECEFYRGCGAVLTRSSTRRGMFVHWQRKPGVCLVLGPHNSEECRRRRLIVSPLAQRELGAQFAFLGDVSFGVWWGVHRGWEFEKDEAGNRMKPDDEPGAACRRGWEDIIAANVISEKRSILLKIAAWG